jgi:hypothetical protein
MASSSAMVRACPWDGALPERDVGHRTADRPERVGVENVGRHQPGPCQRRQIEGAPIDRRKAHHLAQVRVVRGELRQTIGAAIEVDEIDLQFHDPALYTYLRPSW